MFCGGAGGGFGGAGFSAISFRNDETKSSGSCGGGASENFERLGGGASAILCGAGRSSLVSVMVSAVAAGWQRWLAGLTGSGAR